MTNHWIDYRNSDVFMNIGGNTAENHPISMKWIEEARRKRGAKLIVVDPRFTRTAAVADLYVPIRPGTNIAFLGGLINYILEKGLCHEEYVRYYTNASYLLREDFSWDEETALFSGAEEDRPDKPVKYNKSTWDYRRDSAGNVIKDPTLQHPHCVFQVLKRFYARYSLETVSQITGCDPQLLEECYKLYGSTGTPGKAGNILYAMGITQFTHGSQNVRAIGIVQLLLGNMGIPGGGVNAQRGQSNVQGSTDMATLYHIIPGYLGAPKAADHPTLAAYLEKETPITSYWSNKPKFLISMLKAYYGEHATPENDFCYDYLPKLDHRDHSHIGMYKYMGEGEIEGLICWADNPAVTGPSAAAKRHYQSKLKWMVCVDIFENETASFWKAPGADPAEIETEVFLLPATCSFEREGTKANSGRWIQWQWKAQAPPGECKSDLQIAYELFKKLQEAYAADPNGVFPDPITKLKWDYEDDLEPGKVDIVKVCAEINGYRCGDGSLLLNFTQLQDDGSTACGNWIYSGYYNSYEDPPCKRRIKEKEGIGTNPNWAFAWPLNRRIVYNRCSADPSGKPWNPELPLVWWEDGAWKTNDVPDFNATVPPEETAETPFIMTPELQGRLFSSQPADGPLPLHYEPAESPVPNLLYPKASFNPVSQRWYDNLATSEEDKQKFPYIMTTYRITEHYQSGIVTRNMPWLNELMPELFVEIDPELAEKLGISSGDKVMVESKRLDSGSGIIARACVTGRLKPLLVNGKRLHVVGMPFHWGYCGLAKGAITNDLSPSVGDANTTIPEYKAFLCNIRRVE